MADWDENSPELIENLKRTLRRIRQDARNRSLPTLQAARQWHLETMRGLAVPDEKFVGAFRGERGLERAQIRIGNHFGVPAAEVAAALEHFEQTLQRVVQRLDELIPAGSELNRDRTKAILEVCAWAHAEWVRIHPFANGNGRTARLWVNNIAMRYGLPPFMPPRPRPGAGYAIACEEAMRGEWALTNAVLHELLADFAAS